MKLLPSSAADFLEKPTNLDIASSLLPEKPASGYCCGTILPICDDILRRHWIWHHTWTEWLFTGTLTN